MNPVRDLLIAWTRFDLSLRMRRGFDDAAYSDLLEALSACATSWNDEDAIPRLAVSILVDVLPATESNMEMYDGQTATKIRSAYDALQAAIAECVAMEPEDYMRGIDDKIEW